jgi:3-deoxy-D-manno-octulosonate 8-phosphate phosphatase (KDO 8-P phosphatase)
MREAGLSFAVADAHPQALTAAHVITRLAGGQGAVREVCDYLLEARRLVAAPE